MNFEFLFIDFSSIKKSLKKTQIINNHGRDPLLIFIPLFASEIIALFSILTSNKVYTCIDIKIFQIFYNFEVI